MRSDALDIIIETRGENVWLVLSGPFHDEQVPGIKEKILGLLEDGNRRFVIDLDRVSEMGTAIPAMFLSVLNVIKGKNGDLKLIFKNDPARNTFASFRNIFRIYPDAATLARGGFFASLRHRRTLLSRKTGVRISRPVAIFLLIVLCGWFLSLLFIVYLQNQRLQSKLDEIEQLTQWKQHTTIELDFLRERLRPMEQLGLLPDTLSEAAQ